MTLFDKIKNMTIEEMAHFMVEHHSDYCNIFSEHYGECIHGWHKPPEDACEECAKKYLERTLTI